MKKELFIDEWGLKVGRWYSLEPFLNFTALTREMASSRG